MALRSDDNTTRTTRSSGRSGLKKAGIAGMAVAAVVSLGACVPDASVIDQVFGAAAPQANAIAQCESGMNPNAVSRTNDHGLFQINGVHQAYFTQVTGQPWSSIYDAYWNTVYAKHMVDSQGWGPWSCRFVLGG